MFKYKHILLKDILWFLHTHIHLLSLKKTLKEFYLSIHPLPLARSHIHTFTVFINRVLAWALVTPPFLARSFIFPINHKHILKLWKGPRLLSFSFLVLFFREKNASKLWKKCMTFLKIALLAKLSPSRSVIKRMFIIHKAFAFIWDMR